MTPDDAIRAGRVNRVINEFVRPARRGPAVAVEVAAFHVPGEPVPFATAAAAAYEPFAVGDAWGPAWSTTWFRLRGRIPEAWTGRPVALGFAIGNAGSTGFGAEALVWRDGRPVQGLSPNHRRYPVTEAAAGGEDVELLVEAAANPPSPFGANPWPLLLPDPGGAPLFTLQQADLHLVDPEFEAFWHDLRVVAELWRELPAEEPRRQRIGAGLDRLCTVLDLPGIGDSWRDAGGILKELLDEPAAPGAHRVSAVGHAHIDTAWLWPLRETVRKCARTFSTVLALMERYPEYRFVVSQAQQLAWMRDHYPDLWTRLRARIAEGRIEPTGSMWVEADCNIPSGESLVRQIVHGKRFFLDELGVETEDVWLPDVFGYSAALPQIMRLGGVRWFLTQKLSWNQYNVLPHHSFLWEGIDGSRVFTHFPPADTYGAKMEVGELRYGVRNFRDHDRSDRSLYLFGWGDGGGGPTDEMLESARRLADSDGLPRLTMEGPRAFFTAAEAETRDPAVWVGELYLELHRGTYTSQAAVKAGNRRGEQALHDAELWAALDTGADYPAGRLDEAWRLLLLHQFHDIIPGSGIHWVYADAARDHARVRAEADAVAEAALGRHAAAVDTAGRRRPVVLFNPLSHRRREVVTVPAPAGPAGVGGADPEGAGAEVAVGPDGRRTPAQRQASGELRFVAEVPACGFAVYDLAPAAGGPADDGDEPATAGPRHLQNGRLRVEFDDDGLLRSVVDRVAGREVLAPGRRGNLFQLHPDYPNFYDAWDVDRFAFDRVEDLVAAESVELVEDGPVVAALRTVRTTGRSRIEQVVSLHRDAPYVDFVTTVDWHEDNRLLKVAFPVAVHSHRATYEIQFGHVERPTHANTSWDEARFEVCGHRWADLSEPGYGVALLNDAKYGYDIRANVLRLSLLRAPTWPDPLADRGRHTFGYRLLPHRGDLRDAGVIAAAHAYNAPMRAVAAEPHAGPLGSAGSFLSVDADHVVVDTVKGGDDGTLVVRLYEAWGRRGRVTLDAPAVVAGAWLTDLLERPIGEALAVGSRVELEMAPFQLVTLKLRLAGPPAARPGGGTPG